MKKIFLEHGPNTDPLISLSALADAIDPPIMTSWSAWAPI